MPKSKEANIMAGSRAGRYAQVPDLDDYNKFWLFL